VGTGRGIHASAGHSRFVAKACSTSVDIVALGRAGHVVVVLCNQCVKMQFLHQQEKMLRCDKEGHEFSIDLEKSSSGWHPG